MLYADQVINAAANAIKAAERVSFEPGQVPGHGHRDGVHWDETKRVCAECRAWSKALDLIKQWKAMRRKYRKTMQKEYA